MNAENLLEQNVNHNVCCLQGWIHRWANGVIAPLKPTKVTVFTIICYDTENNFRNSMRLDYRIY